jgi:hypothetical protein
MLASGRTSWRSGDRVRVYRTTGGSGSIVPEADEVAHDTDRADPHDYDVEHYSRLLRDTFAARLQRAFTPGDFASVFADPDQLLLFTPAMATIHTVLHSDLSARAI